MTDFNTKIDGESFICRVTNYKPFEPARSMNSAMEDAEDSIDSEFDFELYYPNMVRATALESSLENEDINRLQDEYEAAVTAIKHGLDFD